MKFLDPTVTVTPELSGFDSISPAAVPPVDDSSLSPPQAATPAASTAAASNAQSARNRVLMLIESLLRFWDTIPAPAGCS